MVQDRREWPSGIATSSPSVGDEYDAFVFDAPVTDDELPGVGWI
ncbi:MAG: hypothetical protein ACRELB_16520 [Polyangiaceae bacterium]